MLTKKELLGGLVLGVALGSSAFWLTRAPGTPAIVLQPPPRTAGATSRPEPPPPQASPKPALPAAEPTEVIETATQSAEDAPQEVRQPQTQQSEPPSAALPRNEPPREEGPAERRISAPETPRPQERGLLSVYSRPWSEVWVDGASYGDTPVELELAEGQHEVVLRHDGQKITKLVTITAGSTERIIHNW